MWRDTFPLKTGAKHSTVANYNFVRNILKNEPFGERKIAEIKTSDAKLFLIKMQQDGKGIQHGQDGARSFKTGISDGGGR